MRIQYLQTVTMPRASVGTIHEIREVPLHVAESLIDAGLALEINPDPPPVVHPEVKDPPQTATKKTTKTNKKPKKARRRS